MRQYLLAHLAHLAHPMVGKMVRQAVEPVELLSVTQQGQGRVYQQWRVQLGVPRY